MIFRLFILVTYYAISFADAQGDTVGNETEMVGGGNEAATTSSLVCEAGKCTFTRIDTDGFAATSTPNPGGTFPTCFLCSCPWCDGEEFLAGISNPQAILPIPPAFQDETPPGFTEVPCILLENAASSNQFPPNACIELQLITEFRETCGCPDLPSPPPSPMPLNDTDPMPNMTITPTMTPDTTLAPWTDPINQDILSDSVAITRDYRSGLFNAYDPENSFDGPSGTEWARLPEGQTFEEARCGLFLCGWQSCFTFSSPPSTVGVPGVVHVLEEDLYYNIMFTNWTSGRNNGNSNELGGGFQYIRDEVPIDGSLLDPCPVCVNARPSVAVLRGPIDHSFVNVTIEGVTPSDAMIEILSISQDHSPECNYVASANETDRVRPNARIFGSVAQLRRTRIVGSLSAVQYRIRFSATTTSSASTCFGQVNVCVPAPGFQTCESNIGTYDATSTRYCGASLFPPFF